MADWIASPVQSEAPDGGAQHVTPAEVRACCRGVGINRYGVPETVIEEVKPWLDYAT